MNARRSLVGGTVLIALLCCSAYGQNSPSSDDLEFWVAPYFWMAGIDGDVTVDGTRASIDADFGDIWDDIDFGAQVYLEARKDPWGFFADVSYVGLSADASASVSAVDIESTLAGFGVLYRAHEGYRDAEGRRMSIDVLAGGRYVYMDTELDMVTGPTVRGNKDWIDPIVGLDYRGELTDKIHVNASGDLGGFGIGSDFTWGLRIVLGYELAKWANVWAGWRYLDIDYDDGRGADRFEYDMTLSGPLLGASFYF